MKKARNANKKRSSSKRRKQDDNSKQIREAISWLLSPGIFDGLAFHGNTSWVAAELVALALLWIWSDAGKVTDAFNDAWTNSEKLLGKAALTTYQGMAKALQTWTPKLYAAAVDSLARIDATDRPTPLACWAVGGHRGGWVAGHDAEDGVQRASFLCKELRKGENGQVPQKENQRSATTQKCQSQNATAGTTNLDDDDVAHRFGRTLVLEAGAVQFERTPACDGHDRQRAFP